jgi:hypothetical protein
MGIGAISVSLSFDLNKVPLEMLHKYNDLKLVMDGRKTELDSLFQDLFKSTMSSVKDKLKDTYQVEVHPENYTVFCMTDLGDISKEVLLEKNGRTLATLLTNRHPSFVLSDREIKDVLSSRLSYEENDLVVIDWDSAFLYHPKGNFSDLLLTFELSNLMLLELRAYDTYLNKILENAYNDVDRFYTKKLKYSKAKDSLRNIIETRIDILRMTEELSNTTKFIGEWYLARVSASCAEKFHLADWEKSINRKLIILSELYLIMNNGLEARRMLVLEWAVVIFFLIDLIILALTLLVGISV